MIPVILTGQNTLYKQKPDVARAAIEKSLGNTEYTQVAEALMARMINIDLEVKNELPAEAEAPPKPHLTKPARSLSAADVARVQAAVHELIFNVTNDMLKDNLQFFLAKQAGDRVTMQEEAKKQAEAAAKAEEAKKKMGFWSKLFNIVVTALSVVGAAFTGGASLLLMGVMLVVTAVDKVVEKITGKSFLDEALKPVMDAVLKPIMEAIAKLVTDVMKKCGVEDDLAEMVGAMLAAAVMVVVIAVAVKKIPTKAIMKSFSRSLSKHLPKFLTKIGSGATKSVQNLAGGADKAKLLGNNIQRGALVAGVGNAGFQAYADISMAFSEKDIMDMAAKIQELFAASKVMDKEIEKTLDRFSQQIEMLSQSMRGIFDAADQELALGKSILSMVRSRA